MADKDKNVDGLDDMLGLGDPQDDQNDQDKDDSNQDQDQDQNLDGNSDGDSDGDSGDQDKDNQDDQDQNDSDTQDDKDDSDKNDKDDKDADSDDKSDDKDIQDKDTSLDDVTAQRDKLLKVIQDLAGSKIPAEKEPEPKASLYEGESFKALVEVLELDEKEAKVLSLFMDEFKGATQQGAVEQALRSTPEIVGKFVKRDTVMTEVKKDFYNNHPQLVKSTKYVKGRADTIAAENPDWLVKDILEEAAKQTYDALGIQKTLVKKGEKKEKKKPAFSKSGGSSRKQQPKVDKLTKEINTMMALE